MAEKPRKKHPLSFAAWLIILVASIFSVSLLLFAFSYVSFREQQENILLDTLDKNGRQAADYTNALLTDIENVLVLPLFAGDTGSFFEEAAVYAQTGEKSAAYSQSVRQSLQMLFNYKTTIHAVVFYVPGRGSDSVLRGVNNLSLSPPAGQPWYDACAADLNGGPVLVSTYKLYASDYGGRDTYVFGVARSVIDVDNSRVAGVLQIGINETTLYSFLKNALTLPGQELVVADGEGRIISSTDRTAVGKLLSETAFTAVLGEAGDAQSLISEAVVSWTGWKVYSIVPTESVTRQVNQTIGAVLLVMLLLLFLSLLLIFAISSRLVRPMQTLTGEMKKVARGDFSVRLREDGLKETAFLSNVFNQMAEELETLVKRKYIDKIAQKELELRMLQYQINPHFLYNSIESIRMTSLLNNDEEAAQMLTSLGKILRYSLSGAGDIVSVRDEVSMLEEYAALQAVRFDDVYAIIVDVDESLYQYKVPKLILQPFVENAIEHGVSCMECGGEILVKGRRDGEDIVFTIKNNGAVMSEETLRWLNEYINSAEEMDRHIGVKNVNKRLKLSFGDKAGVTVGQDRNGRTLITIRFPAVRDSVRLNGAAGEENAGIDQ